MTRVSLNKKLSVTSVSLYISSLRISCCDSIHFTTSRSPREPPASLPYRSLCPEHTPMMGGARGLLLFVACVCAAAAIVNAADQSAANLTYDSIGADWPGLCQTGLEQSPINVIRDDFVPLRRKKSMIRLKSLGAVKNPKMFVTEVLPHVEFTWDEYETEPDITVPADRDGNVFAVLTENVKPRHIKHVPISAHQCHFHTPSESALDGSLYDGVLHCVHFVKDGESKYCDDLKANGGLGCPVVVSIFLQGTSETSPFTDLFHSAVEENVPQAETLEDLELEAGHGFMTGLGKEFGVVTPGVYNLDSFMPKSGEYAAWAGSLTTAPCTEGVLWLKMLTPLEVTPEEIQSLSNTVSVTPGSDCAAIVDGRCHPPRAPVNNREEQKLNGRVLRSGKAF